MGNIIRFWNAECLLWYNDFLSINYTEHAFLIRINKMQIKYALKVRVSFIKARNLKFVDEKYNVWLTSSFSYYAIRSMPHRY